MEDELENLRQQSSRTSSFYDDLEEADEEGGPGLLSSFTPQQRLVLAVLVFLNALAVVFGLLAIIGVI